MSPAPMCGGASRSISAKSPNGCKEAVDLFLWYRSNGALAAIENTFHHCLPGFLPYAAHRYEF
jgi:hypothetical protein